MAAHITIKNLLLVDNHAHGDGAHIYASAPSSFRVVNTSFNVRGEPIVCTPENAYLCFMRTDMDYLIIGDLLFDKSKQPEWTEDKRWQEEFVLD